MATPSAGCKRLQRKSSHISWSPYFCSKKPLAIKPRQPCRLKSYKFYSLQTCSLSNLLKKDTILFSAVLWPLCFNTFTIPEAICCISECMLKFRHKFLTLNHWQYVLTMYLKLNTKITSFQRHSFISVNDFCPCEKGCVIFKGRINDT